MLDVVLDDESVLDVSASAPQWSRLIPLEPALYMAKQQAVPFVQSSGSRPFGTVRRPLGPGPPGHQVADDE